ncbi:MAG: hypothetical protein FWG77_02475 [Treponema sp.]|nr:hypothetical protein [Treponema sp.]
MKRLSKLLPIFILAFVFVFSGCDVQGDDTLVNVRVINETGRDITNVRFTGSDGSFITIEEFARQAHRNQGHCWMRQDDSYTLSWECPVGGPLYAQAGGFCGGRNNAHRFRFNGNDQITIVLQADNTWAYR